MKKLLFLLFFIFIQAWGEGFGLNTLLHTHNGYRPLRSLQKGDQVRSYDMYYNTIELKPIVMVGEHEVDSYVKLKFRNSEIICACNQRLYVPGINRWVEAQEALTDPQIQEIFYNKFHMYELEKVNEKITLGVLTVDELHKFFVEPGLLAHNLPLALMFGPVLYSAPAMVEGVAVVQAASAVLGGLCIVALDYIINKKPQQQRREDKKNSTPSNDLDAVFASPVYSNPLCQNIFYGVETSTKLQNEQYRLMQAGVDQADALARATPLVPTIAVGVVTPLSPLPRAHDEMRLENARDTSVACLPAIPFDSEIKVCGTGEAMHNKPLPEQVCFPPEPPHIPPASCLPSFPKTSPIPCGTSQQKTVGREHVWQCSFSKNKIKLPLISFEEKTADKPQEILEQPASGGSVESEAPTIKIDLIEETELTESDRFRIEEKRRLLIDKVLEEGAQDAEIYYGRLKDFVHNKNIPESAKEPTIKALNELIEKVEEQCLNKAFEIENLDHTNAALNDKPPTTITFPEVDGNEILKRINELKNDPRIISLQELYEETPAFRTLKEVEGLSGIIVGENDKYYRFPGPVEAMTDNKNINCKIIAEEWSAQIYEEFIADKNDINTIAQSTGIPNEILSEIKKHLFFEKHYLDTGFKTFDPDPQQCAAWIRLIEGDYINNDIQWLIHELAELDLLKGPAKNFVRPAHEALNKNNFRWHCPRPKEK